MFYVKTPVLRSLRYVLGDPLQQVAKQPASNINLQQ
jgi:hypothetical protein